MSVTAAGAASQVYTAQSTSSKSNPTQLSMDDFFNLLAAQLSNQNMLDPVDNTEFIAQMAQISALSAMQNMSGTFSNYLSVSYIGKNITAVQTDASGKETAITGVAQKVEFINGKTYITVNDTRISPEDILSVSETSPADSAAASQSTAGTSSSATTNSTATTTDSAATDTTA